MNNSKRYHCTWKDAGYTFAEYPYYGLLKKCPDKGFLLLQVAVAPDPDPCEELENRLRGSVVFRKSRRFRSTFYVDDLPELTVDELDESQSNGTTDKGLVVRSLDVYSHSGTVVTRHGTGTQCQFDTAVNVAYWYTEKERVKNFARALMSCDYVYEDGKHSIADSTGARHYVDNLTKFVLVAGQMSMWRLSMSGAPSHGVSNELMEQAANALCDFDCMLFGDSESYVLEQCWFDPTGEETEVCLTQAFPGGLLVTQDDFKLLAWAISDVGCSAQWCELEKVTEDTELSWLVAGCRLLDDILEFPACAATNDVVRLKPEQFDHIRAAIFAADATGAGSSICIPVELALPERSGVQATLHITPVHEDDYVVDDVGDKVVLRKDWTDLLISAAADVKDEQLCQYTCPSCGKTGRMYVRRSCIVHEYAVSVSEHWATFFPERGTGLFNIESPKDCRCRFCGERADSEALHTAQLRKYLHVEETEKRLEDEQRQ